VKLKRFLQLLAWLFGAAFLLFIVILLLHTIKPISLDKLKDSSRVVYDKNAKPLYITTNSKGIWRIPTQAKIIDPLYIKMLLNYEDKNFYKHFGVDFLALGRATWQYISHRRVISGASTITMQLAKLLEPKPRTLSNKLFEILRAFELELYYSKEEILDAYLTLTPYGGNIESLSGASWRYFAKLPSSLSASEIATLLSLPKAPNYHNPLKYPKKAKKARNKILLKALRASLISQKIYKQAIREPIPTTTYPFPRHAPHLSSKLLKKQIKSFVTLDKNLQIKLEDWAKLKGEALPKDVTIATLIVKNNTGEIVAYLGSHYIFSKKTQGFVNMIEALRSPGSTLKPFIYALGFNKHIIAPLTIIQDSESVFANYKPRNFSNSYSGEVTIAYALQHSLNIPAVKVLQRVGVHNLVELLNSISSYKIPHNKASLSLALGGLGVTMEQLASYYSALANDGKAVRVHYNSKSQIETKPFLDTISARTTNAILQEVQPPKGFLKTPIPIAFKTGTSYGFRDFWCVAYTKEYSVILLVAKPNGKPMLASSGREKAAPLAFEVMGIVASLYGLKPWGYNAKEYLQEPPKILQYFDNKKSPPLKKFRFAYPKKEARYRSSNCKDVKVKALLENGSPPYSWYIDGKQLKQKNKKIAHYFNSGAHTITAIDAKANIISQTIWVDKPDCMK